MRLKGVNPAEGGSTLGASLTSRIAADSLLFGIVPIWHAGDVAQGRLRCGKLDVSAQFGPA
jgi:hypothetical protein